MVRYMPIVNFLVEKIFPTTLVKGKISEPYLECGEKRIEWDPRRNSQLYRPSRAVLRCAPSGDKVSFFVDRFPFEAAFASFPALLF